MIAQVACPPSAAYPTRSAANDVKRGLVRVLHLPVSVLHCEECDCYHLSGNGPKLRVPKKCLRVIKLIAQGYTQPEIAKITGIAISTIQWYLYELKYSLAANSSAHLVAIMISMGFFNPRDFVPPITERTQRCKTQ